MAKRAKMPKRRQCATMQVHHRLLETVPRMAVDARTLLGRWVHSHEEDSADQLVFRPAHFAFPPSRGRLSLELEPDGRFVRSGLGPAERPLPSRGRWTLEDDRLTLKGDGASGKREMRVASVTPERLVVRRQT